MSPPSSTQVELLILGAGWTSKFLIPLLESNDVPFAATSRNGRQGTIPFNFDPSSENNEQYRCLPDATTVLITFPVTENVKALVDGYQRVRKHVSVNWIQLGSTGSFKQSAGWVDRHAGIEHVPRSVQEGELLKHASATVLHLAGLWGSGKRYPVYWVKRIAPNKTALAAKGSLHLIHGEDVARAILATHRNFGKLAGQRWCISDLRVYDWWELVSSWAPSVQNGECDTAEDPRLWVKQLMGERGVRALPRPMEQLGRTLDCWEFWEVIGISPTVTLHSAIAYTA
ncbi:hypothetical protein BJ322DRAFT_1090007 [Thelephora terrestris]|uniref:NAD(P)-binding domain-containing protein n=1 Tax=Thelephora terrestris TaxID=56493 RepID=A0A9P6H3Q7_9AGAM|nr:hypothetical protein BJ322DRAFT_1090007 [Thelephora terrestris]